jgi:type I restriction enzyme R subunit
VIEPDYGMILDPASGEFNPTLYALGEITKRIRNLTPQVDISEVKAAVEAILDESIGTLKYVIPESKDVPPERLYVDLSQIDFDALKAEWHLVKRDRQASSDAKWHSREVVCAPI